MDATGRFLILRKIRYGEADLILQALSPHGEKMSFMARGALKSKKRFGGGILEPSHFVQLNYHKAAEGKMHTLKEASLVNDFAGLRTKYDNLEFALRMLEVVSRVSLEGDSTSEYLFNLLGHGLKAAETAEDIVPLKAQFYLKFLLQQGVLTPEAWMAPFLKLTLAEHLQLRDQRQAAVDHLHDLETVVDQYIRTASV